MCYFSQLEKKNNWRWKMLAQVWKEPPLQFLCLIVLSNIWVMCNRNWAVIRLQLLKLLSLASLGLVIQNISHTETKKVQTKFPNWQFFNVHILPFWWILESHQYSWIHGQPYRSLTANRYLSPLHLHFHLIWFLKAKFFFRTPCTMWSLFWDN